MQIFLYNRMFVRKAIFFTRENKQVQNVVQLLKIRSPHILPIWQPPDWQFSSQLIESERGRIAVIGTDPNPLGKACEGRIVALSQLPYKSKPCPIRSAIWSQHGNEISHLLSEPSVDAKPN